MVSLFLEIPQWCVSDFKYLRLKQQNPLLVSPQSMSSYSKFDCFPSNSGQSLQRRKAQVALLVPRLNWAVWRARREHEWSSVAQVEETQGFRQGRLGIRNRWWWQSFWPWDWHHESELRRPYLHQKRHQRSIRVENQEPYLSKRHLHYWSRPLQTVDRS